LKGSTSSKQRSSLRTGTDIDNHDAKELLFVSHNNGTLLPPWVERQRALRERQQALRVSESLRLAMEAREGHRTEPETALRVAWEAVLWDRNELSQTVYREALSRMPAPFQLLRKESESARGVAGYGTSATFLSSPTRSKHGLTRGASMALASDSLLYPEKGVGPSRPLLTKMPLIVARNGSLFLYDLQGTCINSLALPD